MILSEKLETARDRTVLFMLALLEVGAVALVLAVAILGAPRLLLLTSRSSIAARPRYHRPDSDRDRRAPLDRLRRQAWPIAVLRVVSWGLRFRQRRVRRHHVGRGIERRLLRVGARADELAAPSSRRCLPYTAPLIVIVVATFSAIFSILYAFQQDDWRLSPELLIGRECIHRCRSPRRRDAVPQLQARRSRRSGMDRGPSASGRPRARQRRRFSWPRTGCAEPMAAITSPIAAPAVNGCIGVGALLAAMSLAAMPPTAGFVSE